MGGSQDRWGSGRVKGMEGGKEVGDSSREPRWFPGKGQAVPMGYGCALAAIPPARLQNPLGLSCLPLPAPPHRCP